MLFQKMRNFFGNGSTILRFLVIEIWLILYSKFVVVKNPCNVREKYVIKIGARKLCWRGAGGAPSA